MHSLLLPRLAAVAVALAASVAFAQPTVNVVNTTALNAEFSNAGKGAFAPQTVGLTGVAFGTGLTAGFVIGGGSTPVRVLIRVAGPGLAQFGVGGTVVDPQLALFNAQSVQIAANNDWNNAADVTAAGASVGAFPLPAGSRDAALVTTLQPGNYSVRATGVNATTGVALVEVYELP